ncbi:MAG: cation-translocating P-type ATPase C-terminal domain-containing protein [Candidatus Nitricoxidivorans perseverans]|uniref:Cation-translocating P-type ATPase C-terminal domain-containing protein n=1 Tax=Candidatus Nitricoxidivorans perseverans TaxID=2975601 RepID=A0AA49FP19_9PROT|nr:MAG: cation-translocating P-type ATPase C-terminal domain-containing protein [Candidatus Nitricoxidivorans perseverans]
MNIAHLSAAEAFASLGSGPGGLSEREAAEGALLLAIVYTPWGNRLFGTAPLGLDVWLYMLPFALTLGASEEARKAFVSAFRRGSIPARP